MLLYYCATASDLARIRDRGLTGIHGVDLWTSLEAAESACADCLLVVDADALPEFEYGGTEDRMIRVPEVPPAAFRNLDPYLPPLAVVAAGGYVVRPGTSEPDVVLILRRGVWDLPKGKREPGESVEACAEREVREEIGLETLQLRRALGTTVHAYPEKGYYRVKTTYWFLMRTSEERLRPQEGEDIERAGWFAWSDARRRIGYETLRRHMAQIEPIVFQEVVDRSIED